tara:strand:- start:385 stop:957 length:573 start_codon:yes stop_codon:yes gene_type:complete
MIEIIHRVNHNDQLNEVPNKYGVEIDIRSNDNKLVLGHDIHKENEDFNKYINSYQHKFLVANIKESGIEERVINKLNDKNISNFFLLDVEFPFILKNFNQFGNNLSLRFSKYEGIDTINNFIGKVKWVWIDTYDDFDLDSNKASILQNFNLCLVSPSRWGHENKINYYINKFKDFGLSIDAAMIDIKEAQ